MPQATSYMLNTRLADMMVEELTDLAWPVLGTRTLAGPAIKRADVRGIVADFVAVYRERPMEENVGGSRFHNCFWLYVIARYRNPKLIVESGVWKGQTSWLFTQACPHAIIHSFDINLKTLLIRCDQVNYHEMDWMAYDFSGIDTSDSLIFFDCHVNQAMRIKEAYDRGFKDLLFDDNPPAHKLYPYCIPGMPTVEMVLDDSLREGEVINWIWNGEPKEYVMSSSDMFGARSLIKERLVLPDASDAGLTGGYSYLTAVKLV